MNYDEMEGRVVLCDQCLFFVWFSLEETFVEDVVGVQVEICEWGVVHSREFHFGGLREGEVG